MKDLVFFDVQGFYRISQMPNKYKRHWTDWMRGVGFESAHKLVQRGNSETKGLRIVEVQYTVIDKMPEQGSNEPVFIVQGKYPLDEDGTHMGSTREWHDWMVNCTYSQALKYVERGNDLTTGLRIVTMTKTIISTYDKNGAVV